MEAVVEPFENSLNAAFICVITTLVGVPFAVKVPIAAETSLKLTPNALAIGDTWAILPAISPKLVLPFLTAVNIKSLACAALIAFSPQAFTIELSPSTAVVTSVTPAVAPF